MKIFGKQSWDTSLGWWGLTWIGTSIVMMLLGGIFERRMVLIGLRVFIHYFLGKFVLEVLFNKDPLKVGYLQVFILGFVLNVIIGFMILTLFGLSLIALLAVPLAGG